MTGLLVHEWIAKAGGSENVLERFGGIFPDAPVFCLWNDRPGLFAGRTVQESWLSRSPLRGRKAAALPLMPLTWRTARPPEADWVLISSHLFAHHIAPQGGSIPRFVYVHTPARYIWTPELDARGTRLAPRAAAAMLRPLDRRRAHEGAVFAANSEFVRQRIEKAWGVDAVVIHPPVDVTPIQDGAGADALTAADELALAGLPSEFVLGASRFIPYKRLDLVVATAEAAGLPVVLAGAGPEQPRLVELARTARVPVHFVERPSTPLLWELFRRATVYVFPAVEDFGIMPVEALAAGAPVVARATGGTAESVEHAVSGALTEFASASDMREAVAVAVATSRTAREERARAFSAERFDERIHEWVGA